jgi:hypothetical protein
VNVWRNKKSLKLGNSLGLRVPVCARVSIWVGGRGRVGEGDEFGEDGCVCESEDWRGLRGRFSEREAWDSVEEDMRE